MRRKLIGVALAAALVGGVVGVAAASIPDSQGVIHGCYKTNNPNRGQVVVVDTDAGQNCSTGYTALNWNKSVASGYEIVSNTQQLTLNDANGWTNSLFVTCPVGKVVTGGGGTAGQSGRAYLSSSAPDTDKIWRVYVKEDPHGDPSYTNTLQVTVNAVCVFS